MSLQPEFNRMTIGNEVVGRKPFITDPFFFNIQYRSLCDPAESLQPHPTITEGVHEWAHMILGPLRFINLKYFNPICDYHELHTPISLSEIQESKKRSIF